eukprot:TRINITY_DN24629_c0_g1_i1.p1 TRINITY_DN24629_c0_g1~~TRINITY_DN24629_c0_g1_i1.p1  ORF type:complete len:478 (-),score=26.73 TRINITY_DN24629_c0_g1_i1:229-1662(-)
MTIEDTVGLRCSLSSPDVEGSFVDLYAALSPDARPDSPLESLRKAYMEKQRLQHDSDQRFIAIARAAADAWEVLRDDARKACYDIVWAIEEERGMLVRQQSDVFRRNGNDVYHKARLAANRGGSAFRNMAAIQDSIRLYKHAMEEYSAAVALTPHDYRIYSNRAMCYAAVEDWPRCRDDALLCTRLKPDFMKGWFLYAKALKRLGCVSEAHHVLSLGLHELPDCWELSELQSDLNKELTLGETRGCTSRSVSPVVTPTPSRQTTPSKQRQRCQTPPRTPPRSNCSPRSASPSLPSVPQPAVVEERAVIAPKLDASSSYHTGNFGVATPCFAGSRSMPSVWLAEKSANETATGICTNPCSEQPVLAGHVSVTTVLRSSSDRGTGSPASPLQTLSRPPSQPTSRPPSGPRPDGPRTPGPDFSNVGSGISSTSPGPPRRSPSLKSAAASGKASPSPMRRSPSLQAAAAASGKYSATFAMS